MEVVLFGRTPAAFDAEFPMVESVQNAFVALCLYTAIIELMRQAPSNLASQLYLSVEALTSTDKHTTRYYFAKVTPILIPSI